MTVPARTIPVPRAVLDIAGGEPVVPVWRNKLGGITFRLGSDRYVKWKPVSVPGLDFAAEAQRLRWAGPFTVVPKVIEHGHSESDEWLITAALPGSSAVDARWAGAPERVARHADACAPNTLLDADGRFLGHVDLGALGAGDRWADLAIATLSLEWNFRAPRPDLLLEAYGVEADWPRIAYYRALWDATD